MSELSKIPPSESSKLSLKSSGNIILNELPTEQVLTHIAGLLHDIAKLYQIPNWGVENSAHLASWILRNYKYERLGLVVKCLESPPINDAPVWRLTPDTIGGWMSILLDKEAALREKEIHNAKHEEVKSEWTDERLEELKKIAEAVEDFKIPSLTQEDIQKEGQEKPIIKPPILPLSDVDIEIRTLATKFGVTEYQMKQLRIRWGKDCFDILTGKKLPDWIPFDKWLTIPE